MMPINHWWDLLEFIFHISFSPFDCCCYGLHNEGLCRLHLSGWPSGLRRQTQGETFRWNRGRAFWSTYVGVGSNPTSDKFLFSNTGLSVNTDDNVTKHYTCWCENKTGTKQVLTRFELVTFCVWSRRDNHYTTEPPIIFRTMQRTLLILMNSAKANEFVISKPSNQTGKCQKGNASTVGFEPTPPKRSPARYADKPSDCR